MYQFDLNSTSTSGSPRTVTGRRLTPNKMTPSRRAGIAAQIIRGEVVLTGVTTLQACKLTGANSTYVRKALQASASEREALARGWWGMSWVNRDPGALTPSPGLLKASRRATGSDDASALAAIAEFITARNGEPVPQVARATDEPLLV